MSEPARILNVDDRETNRYIRTTVLREAGYRVLEASTGQEALDLFLREKPQLVLLDVNLPDIHGREVCRRIKAGQVGHPVVVIHISAEATGVDEQVFGLESGADAYLTEPVRPELMLATVRSLLRLWHTEQQLADSLERLQLAEATVAFWDWDLARGTAVCSPEYLAQCGLGPEPPAATIEDWFRPLHPADREPTRAALNGAIAQRSPWQGAYRIVRPAGEVRWLLARVNVFLGGADGDGPARVIGTSLDITDRKRAEDSLQHSNEELRQFAYAASHDLQEPLRTVATHTQFLTRRLEGKLDPESAVMAGFIADGIARMQAMVHGLLAYVQIQEGLVPGVVCSDSRRVLEQVLEGMATVIGETGANVTYGNLPAVAADPAQLGQVFQNLISNSIKYRRQDTPPRIEVRGERCGHECMFTVSDNGTGFHPKYADQIFGVFKRLHARTVPGAGIGLAIVRKIVSRTGGRVWAESEPDKGAVFHFTLPSAEESAAARQR